MLTLDEIVAQRRQQLLEFFAWRFSSPEWITALVYCTGLSRSMISRFRCGRPIPFLSLKRIEGAALNLGFRPGRVLSKSGKFGKPARSAMLPRWSDPAIRIRFYQWRRQTCHGTWKTERIANQAIIAARRKGKAPIQSKGPGQMCNKTATQCVTENPQSIATPTIPVAEAKDL
jgi:hypothetical protein